MKQYPTVSVIVLNYNGKHYLNDIFSSLEKIDYPADRLKLVMADNASTDGSQDFMHSKFPQVEIIQMEKNYGFAKANNIAAAQQNSEWVVFVNNDTAVDKLWLKGLINPTTIDSTIACCGSKIVSWDGRKIDFAGMEINFYGFGNQTGLGQPATDFNEITTQIGACGGSMAVKRKIFLDIGGFDEDFFIFFEDVDFGWRLANFGYKTIFCPKSIIYHNHHGTMKNAERNWFLYERNALCTIYKNYSDENLKKVLPASILLLFKRIIVDVENIKYPIGTPKNNASSLILESIEESSYERLVNLLKTEGLIGSTKHIKQFILKKIIRVCYKLLNLDDSHLYLSGYSKTRFLALSSFIDLLPVMTKKRAEIQRQRKSSDEDVLKLFKSPFNSVSLWQQYIELEKKITLDFGINKIFGAKKEKTSSQDICYPKIQVFRDEKKYNLKHIQWDQPKNGQRYTLYYKNSKSSKWLKISSNINSPYQHEFIGLSKGKYNFLVTIDYKNHRYEKVSPAFLIQ